MKDSLQKILGVAALSLCGFSAQAATLSVMPSSYSVTQGSSFSVTIAIAGLTDASAPALADFDIDVHFDAGMFGYAGFTWGDSALGDQLDLAQLGSLAFADESGAATGSLNYFEVSYDDSALLNASQAGSFGLLTLTFNALSSGASAISVSVNALGDTAGNTLTAQIENASVAVTQVPVPPALPMLASALLLAGSGIRTRRNK